jgi:hypothetical protein
MRFMMGITRLPLDLLEVQHILPFWFTYLYWFLWTLGIAVVAFLVIFLFTKLIGYLNSLPAARAKQRLLAREFPRERLKMAIAKIRDDTLHSGSFRQGCHQLSALLRTYYDIHLKKDVEEMTATEIQREIKERTDLGDYFVAMRGLQFQSLSPTEEEFRQQFDLTLKVVK